MKHHKRNKKGMELSMTMIVTLIISILIFGASLFLIGQIWTGTEDISKNIDANTEQQIRGLISTGQIVAMPENTFTISRSGKINSWIGIRNINGKNQEFSIKTQFDSGFDIDEKPIADTDWEEDSVKKWFFGEGIELPFEIKNNEMVFKHIFIKPGFLKPGKLPPQGTYFINVCVTNITHADPKQAELLLKNFECSPTGNPNDEHLYPQGKIFQIAVKIE